MATNRLFRLRFEVIFIWCLSGATSFAATTELGRIVVPANSSAQTASAGLQKLSGRNGLLYIPKDHAKPLPLLILLHKAGGSPSEWFGGSGSYAPYADKGRFIILVPESPGQTWGTGPKKWGYDYLAINRALEEAFARWRSIATGSPSADSPTARRTRFRLAWPMATCSATSSHFHRALSLGLRPWKIRSQGRGSPLVYIAHGQSDNVLPIASTSRIFVSSLRKNGYNVEFREFSGGHHLSR